MNTPNFWWRPSIFGLSSISFAPLEELKKDFGLYFFDPMGTTTPLKTAPTYEALLSELKENISVQL